ncbi:MAG: hypothetical protein AAFY29_04245 [Pseudomonadota bacterium]
MPGTGQIARKLGVELHRLAQFVGRDWLAILQGFNASDQLAPPENALLPAVGRCLG